MSLSPGATVALAWLLLAALVFGLEAPPAGEPGLYYDEAFLAQQGRDFLEPERETVHPPSTVSVEIAGRRFPLRNAAYLGSLKSQLAIPALAAFGSSVPSLRTATLATALLGLLLAMLWAQRVFGLQAALLAGALVAFDPSFVFFGACEWGPFTTMLLCRALGLYLLTVGWQTRRGALVVAGAFALGLGVYARADFVLIGAALALAAVVALRGALWRQLRERPATVAAALVALVLGALPMLVSLADLLAARQGVADRGSLGYRALVLWSTLDGSHFHRLMQTGGLFEHLFDTDAPASPFAVVVLLALGTAVFTRMRRDPGVVFLAVATASLAAFMLLLPGAVRAHHMLNLLPFAHLLVAVVLVRGARSPRSRVVAVGLAVSLLAASARVTALTLSEIAESGGRGRFSNALDAFAAEIEAEPAAVVVSLDWGFHEPLLFLTSFPDARERLLEPIWEIPRLLAHRRPWTHKGDASHVYLVHGPPYDLFGIGSKLLETAEELPTHFARVGLHRDREGGVAFYSIRFAAPHELVYTGSWDIRTGGAISRD